MAFVPLSTHTHIACIEPKFWSELELIIVNQRKVERTRNKKLLIVIKSRVPNVHFSRRRKKKQKLNKIRESVDSEEKKNNSKDNWSMHWRHSIITLKQFYAECLNHKTIFISFFSRSNRVLVSHRVPVNGLRRHIDSHGHCTRSSADKTNQLKLKNKIKSRKKERNNWKEITSLSID